MSLKTIIEILLAAMSLATAFFVAKAKIKEAKLRRKDPSWQPNPKRCQEERDRIVALEGKNEVWGARFDSVDKGIEDLKASQKTLIDLHLKA
jgi:hypothetical protein